MIQRRRLLKLLSGIPLFGTAGIGLGYPNNSQGSKTPFIISEERDLFTELGIRTFINCAGPFTTMTGCLMPDEVLETIKKTGKNYVDLNVLYDKVGERIAELLDCEGALVSSGCFGAMSVGMAGIMTGVDRKLVQQLPNTEGLKNEVIMQESHAGGYTKALSNVGAKIITVKNAEELHQAINDKTALLWFLNKANNLGEIDDEGWV
ncbi:MAG: hypothetical protein KDC53_07245, partial [Saprospiraceae bacterium]|nr:hypothetical protein [Saprospiraceae bacterium]